MCMRGPNEQGAIPTAPANEEVEQEEWKAVKEGKKQVSHWNLALFGALFRLGPKILGRTPSVSSGSL